MANSKNCSHCCMMFYGEGFECPECEGKYTHVVYTIDILGNKHNLAVIEDINVVNGLVENLRSNNGVIAGYDKIAKWTTPHSPSESLIGGINVPAHWFDEVQELENRAARRRRK